MDEKNPLQVSPTLPLVSNGNVLNKRGRPPKGTMLKFGPQPKSIIGQMLSQMKTKSNIIEEDPPNPHDLPQDPVEPSHPEHDVCQTCPHRSANTFKEHKKHLSSRQLFICDYPNCSYSCKLSSNLIKHKRVHTNEKPYLCDRCSFRTNFVNSLKAHKRTHTAEKPYHCKHCSYKCNSSSNLKKHCHLRHSEGNNES